MDCNFVSAIIVAAGNSTRMHSSKSKQFISLLNKPAIYYTFKAFESAECINEVVVVCREQDKAELEMIVKNNKFNKVKAFCNGGETRGESVKNGIAITNEKAEYFAIHDGARPLINTDDIEKVVEKAFDKKATTLGVAVKDTIKIVGDKNIILSTPDRNNLRAIQTPQVFEKELYLKSLELAKQQGKDYTDDCQLIENFGEKVFVVLGSEENLKLTTPFDVILAESILKKRFGGDGK